MGLLINRRLALAVLLAAALLVQGCARIKQIRIVSCDVESVSMKGMRGISAVVSARTDNPAGTIMLSDIGGTVYMGSNVLGSFTADSFSLEGRCVSDNRIQLDFALDRSVSFMEILSLIRDMDLGSITVDISFKARPKGGIPHRMKFEKVPASRLVSGKDILGRIGGLESLLAF